MCVVGDVIVRSHDSTWQNQNASAVLGASGHMVPAFTIRSDRSDLPNLKARTPDRLRSEAPYKHLKRIIVHANPEEVHHGD